MLTKQPCGLPGRRYFAYPATDVPRMVEDLEEGRLLVVSLEHFFPASQYGEGVTAVADDQVARETVVYVPAGLSEPLLYLFGGLHALPPHPRE